MTSAAETEAAPSATTDDEGARNPLLDELLFFYEEGKDLWAITLRTFFYTLRAKFERSAVFEQCFAIGNQSLFFMSVTMGFVGAIIMYQICTQTLKVVPDLGPAGATYLKLLIRDLGPSVGALPLATRVGAAIAAQLGSMVVTEQTDALRMCSADPVDYLIVPRFLASCVMGTVILVIGIGVAYVVGSVIAWGQFHVNPHIYFSARLVKWTDCVLCLIKCVSYGGIMAIVSGQRGLRTFGGSEGVGKATTEAVVGSMFFIILANVVLSVFGYFLLPP